VLKRLGLRGAQTQTNNIMKNFRIIKKGNQENVSPDVEQGDLVVIDSRMFYNFLKEHTDIAEKSFITPKILVGEIISLLSEWEELHPTQISNESIKILGKSLSNEIKTFQFNSELISFYIQTETSDEINEAYDEANSPGKGCYPRAKEKAGKIMI
jgi:hypothetical protein